MGGRASFWIEDLPEILHRGLELKLVTNGREHGLPTPVLAHDTRTQL
jgi:hypothetical protein